MNFDDYVSWDSLCSSIKSKTEQVYRRCGHPEHNGLKRKGFPYSISECEFNLMKSFIIKHNLKSGFELATGTCISTLAIGHGFRKTGGMLVSVDSYEEEVTQNMPSRSAGKVFNGKDFILNQDLIKSYNLEESVKLFAGWSPDDCETLLDQHLNGKVDFVFFDCPKNKEDFVRDTSFLRTRLVNDKFAIFVHDTHCFPHDFERLSREIFGIKPKIIKNFLTPGGLVKQKFPLALITNIEV